MRRFRKANRIAGYRNGVNLTTVLCNVMALGGEHFENLKTKVRTISLAEIYHLSYYTHSRRG